MRLNLYISSCANSPAIDRIYLFNNVEEIRNMINRCGFTIEKEIAISADHIHSSQCGEKKANSLYAVMLV